jgi:uroporphyrinogen III methyltransferase/synthase
MLTPSGTVVLVGAGPGDPGLITVRGRAALERAEVVIYDQLVNPRLLELAPSDAEKIFAGKRAGKLVLNQAQINDLLVERARQGKRVVRLKGGDPLVFGRGAEEAAFLRENGVSYRIVPGVTAAAGVSAYAELPITHRSAASAVALVTGHDDPRSGPGRVDWAALARFPGTLVVYMGVARLRSICAALIEAGQSPETPAAIIERGTWPAQRSVEATLSTLADQSEALGLHPPALLVVGTVVGIRPKHSWFESLPLFGQRIVITRPAEDAASSVESLEALGADVLVAPTVEIQPLADFSRLDTALAQLDRFDWLVFTSRHGVDAFFNRLRHQGRDARALGPMRLAAIGPGTAEQLTRWNLRADLVPDRFDSEGLVEGLRPEVAGRRVLLARADRGRTLLRDELATIAQVEQVAVYRNVDAPAMPAELVAALEAGRVDWITLTSSAITERLAALLPDAARAYIGTSTRLVSISPVTTQTARRLGWSVAAEGRSATWPGLVAALCDACRLSRETRSSL